MAQSGSEFDVVIVGAGAAGLAAGRRLLEAGLSVLAVEARDRIGGRAVTVPTPLGNAVDLGCEWLHSADRNEWTAIARDQGRTIDQTLPDWSGRVARQAGEDAQDDYVAAWAEFEARMEQAAQAPRDMPASDLLPAAGPWNSLLGAISTWANATELERVSVKDHMCYADSGINWRVVEGYGTVIAAYGKPVPTLLGTPVRRIDHSGTRVVVATDMGALRARAVIVAVPPSVLAAEAIRFTPALPDKLAAAEGLPLGVANKLFLRLDGPVEAFPVDCHVVGSIDRVATGNYELRPHGWPLIAGFFGGRLAIELEAAGPDAMTAFALDELAGVFGNGIRGRLSWLASSAWAQDPFALGSYSCALPGHAGARAVLATAVDQRLFFAGEACSADSFSTAHGAYRTGRAAAEQVIAALAR
jgi:monoamine oxidase